MAGAGGLKENEAGAAGAEGGMAGAWGLPKLLELSIVGQAKELKF